MCYRPILLTFVYELLIMVVMALSIIYGGMWVAKNVDLSAIEISSSDDELAVEMDRLKKQEEAVMRARFRRNNPVGVIRSRPRI